MVQRTLLRVVASADGAERVLLTQSCTGALEMTALLADVTGGDEVILPSFTFTTTASAFALRGATPVFVDVRDDTLNLDPRRVEVGLTERTRAIVAVHYAGVGCQMDELRALAARHELLLIEDAQGLGSTCRAPLGSIGALGTISFHETKNVISGEGGSAHHQRRGARRSSGGSSGEGNEPSRVLSRSGRQVLVAGPGLVVRPE